MNVYKKLKDVCFRSRWKGCYYDDKAHEVLLTDIHSSEVKTFINYFKKRFPDTRHGEERITIYKGLPIRLGKNTYYNILIKSYQ